MVGLLLGLLTSIATDVTVTAVDIQEPRVTHVAYGTSPLPELSLPNRPAERLRPHAAMGPDPCHGRVLCGPLHLVPQDPVERRAFYAALLTSLADGLVTAAGTRPYAHPDAVTGQTLVSPSGWGEMNPFEAPFVHGGQVAPIITSGLFYHVVASSLERRWSPEERTRLDNLETSSHVYGISTWLPAFEQRAQWDRNSATCQHIVTTAGVRGPNGVFIAAPGSGAVTAALPAYCQGYTTVHLQTSATR